MGRPKKAAANVASVNVSAKVYPAEKEALDRLVALRGARLREGGTSDETFAGWLRETIRAQAKDTGFPVAEPEAEPPHARVPPPAKPKGSTAKPPSKPKARK